MINIYNYNLFMVIYLSCYIHHLCDIYVFDIMYVQYIIFIQFYSIHFYYILQAIPIKRTAIVIIMAPC